MENSLDDDNNNNNLEGNANNNYDNDHEPQQIAERQQQQLQSLHVQLKIPPFYKKNPATWFKQLEASFHLTNITRETTKFAHALANLPEEFATEVPDNCSTYADLKRAVLNVLEANRFTLIEEAMEAVELNGRKPSQVVAEITRKFVKIGIQPEDGVIKARLITALPPHIRSALVGHEEVPLQQFAKIADSMLAVAPASAFTGPVQVSGQGNPSLTTNLSSAPPPQSTQQINNYRPQYPNNCNPSKIVRQPKPFYDNQKPLLCNAHIYYADRAKSCRTWCRWPSKSNQNLQVLRDNEKSRQSSPERPPPSRQPMNSKNGLAM